MSVAELPGAVEDSDLRTDAGPVLTVVDAGVPDSALSVDELGSRIVGLSGRLSSALCQWLLLVADFDARDGCVRFGLPSTARWLSQHCGLSHRTAVEHVRVARALARFPVLAGAMGTGRLSYSHVRAISRVAHEGEHGLVADLVELSEHSAVAQVETMVRGLRTVEHNLSSTVDAPPTEYISHDWSPLSQWRCHVRLDPEHGAVVQSAIQTLARAEGLTHAQALVRMAEITLAALADSEHPPRPLRGDERAAVVIHLDAANLPAERPAEYSDIAATAGIGADARSRERGAGSAGSGRGDSTERVRPYARIANGPGLPDAVVTRLLCAGRIRTVVHARQPDGHDHRPSTVGDLGRSHRIVTERHYRALLLRDDGCCAHPGCRSTAGLEAHHVRHWIRGGRTDLNNLVLLCRYHHHTHHDGHFSIDILGPGRFRFRRHDGRILEDHVDPTRLIDTDEPIDTEHAHVDGTAATPRWNGDAMDHHWAIAVYAQRREDHRSIGTARPRSAERDPFDPWALVPGTAPAPRTDALRAAG